MAVLSICVKWSGKEYEVSELDPTDTVQTLKVNKKEEYKQITSIVEVESAVIYIILPGENNGEDRCEARETEAAQSESEAALCIIAPAPAPGEREGSHRQYGTRQPRTET